MLTGSEFQTLGAENRKARAPKDSLSLFCFYLDVSDHDGLHGG